MYIVEALRYGDREKHSYIAGLYADLDSAILGAALVEISRSGKYECTISNVKLGIIDTAEVNSTIADFGEDCFQGVINRISKRTKQK